MSKKAFTLIELLTVIGIITVLISIIIPSLKAVKHQVRFVICRKNIAQLSTSLLIYNEENDSFPLGFDDASVLTGPPKNGYLGNLTRDKLGWWWLNHISEDLSPKTIAWCPSRVVSDLADQRNVLCGNYGVNRSICKDSPGITGTVGSEFVGMPLRLSQIRNPSQTLLLTDSGYSLVSWKAAAESTSPRFDNPFRKMNFYIPGISFNKKWGLDISKTPKAIYGRHPNRKINIGYSDGHVSSAEAESLIVDDPTNINYKWLGK